MKVIHRTDEEIQVMLDRAVRNVAVNASGPARDAAFYADGVEAAIRWLTDPEAPEPIDHE